MPSSPSPRRPSEHAAPNAARVVCVLGCRAGSATLARRAKAAAEIYHARGATMAVACGGRSWNGLVEADELARMLSEHGVPEAAIVRERCSLDTRDNARFAASLLRRRGVSEVMIVTCTWHLPRAERAFRASGLVVEGLGVDPPDATLLQRLYWHHRERLSSWHDARRTMRIV
ncbi:MAG: putative rane protein [Labilithrix sp.]|nr:putative rane protein [Labilithrix sp.]